MRMVEARKESGTLHVLLLEDNQADANLAIRKLQSTESEIRVDISRNSAEFRQLVESSAYDIILGDYRLPDWTGLEAIQYLRSSGIATPFVLVTGTLGDELAIECIKAGASDYVLKDNLERLPMVVQRTIEEHKLRIEKDRAEEELRRSEEQYRLLFEANPNPMWVYDPETLRFLAVNETAVTKYGYSRAEFLGMKITDIRPSEEVRRFLAQYRKALSVFSGGLTTWRHLKKDGTVIDVEITATNLDFRGKTARLVLAHEISDRVKAELALRESTEHYRAIVDGAPFGIYQSDQSGRILMANPAMVAMLGYEEESEVVTLNLNTDVYTNPIEHDTYVKRGDEAPGKVLHYESRWKRKDGSPITVRLYGRTNHEKKGDVIYEVFVENITEQRSLEQQFRHAQKMEAIGRLAGGVAHDFNNLLMVITSFAQLALESSTDVEKVGRYAKQIQDAAGRAAGVTRQLLAFSRKQIQELRVINLNHLITDFCKMLPRLIGEDIEMVIRTASEDCLVHADRGQIEQVIMNLAVNARDAMANGGKLTIEVTPVELDEQHGWRHEARVPSGRYVMLAVSDTGCGMDVGTQARLFEPFFTTKEAGKGTGLGLATVYGIVKQSKGYIWIYSELQKGTTFKIYLPRVQELSEAEPLARVKAETPSPGNETILLVEDEVMLRAANREFLESRGYTVLEASSGDEAIRICSNYDRQIHLLLTDVVMPGKGGPDLAHAILKIRPGIRVIYMSGYTDSSIDARVLSPDVSFLQKPCSLETVERKIRAMLDL